MNHHFIFASGFICFGVLLFELSMCMCLCVCACITCRKIQQTPSAEEPDNRSLWGALPGLTTSRLTNKFIFPLVCWYISVEHTTADVERSVGQMAKLIETHMGPLLENGCTLDQHGPPGWPSCRPRGGPALQRGWWVRVNGMEPALRKDVVEVSWAQILHLQAAV